MFRDVGLEGIAWMKNWRRGMGSNVPLSEQLSIVRDCNGAVLLVHAAQVSDVMIDLDRLQMFVMERWSTTAAQLVPNFSTHI